MIDLPRPLRAAAALALACAACGEAPATTPPATTSPTPPSSPSAPPRDDTPPTPPDAGAADDVSPPERGAKRVAPPLSGGTLLVLRDDVTAVAADPDFDRVYVADLASVRRVHAIDLRRGDEPGRVVEGDPGFVHVALRQGGAVVSINARTGAILQRVAVCPAPRGMAYDARSGALHVACAGGELVTLDAKTGAVRRALRLSNDLRDVALVGDALWVSRFRSAEVLVLDGDGVVLRTLRPAWGADGSEPGVAWRMRPYLNGVAMVHQRAGVSAPAAAPTPMNPGYYSPAIACNVGMTPAQVTVFLPDTAPGTTPWISSAVLPLDFVLGEETRAPTFAVLSAGAVTAPSGNASVSFVSVPVSATRTTGACIGNLSWDGNPNPVAIEVWNTRRYVVQYRDPPSLRLTDTGATISFDTRSVGDDGHRMFHHATAQFVACASCHPEGGDDGHTWRLTGQGLRRTPDLRGGILATAPFHWDGALTSMGALVSEVFVRRMGGVAPSPATLSALTRWLDAVPSTPASAPRDADAVTRGRAVFDRPDTQCASCHAGPRMTNNTTVDVGTGAPFQVPSLLGLGGRAPYLHDGCAATVRDRFGRCGGGELHGRVKQLRDDELDDLIAYLESL